MVYVVHRKLFRTRLLANQWKALEGTITELEQHWEDTQEQEGEQAGFKSPQLSGVALPRHWEREGVA